jgi:prolipoprotein diacylglyceryl transferase
VSLPLSIPSPPPSWAQFHLGPLTIHSYALCILVGIAAAVIIASRRLTARGAEKGVVVDIAIWIIPLGIIGARFYHVFTHGGDYFYPGANLWNVFAIWDGGNALYGAMIGGSLGILIGCRRKGIRFLSFADALAPGMLVAQSLGRFGNYFNHELFGLPTTLPWGLQILPTDTMFPKNLPAGTLFHPLFLYEIIWNLLGVAIILVLERRFRLRWPHDRAVLRLVRPGAQLAGGDPDRSDQRPVVRDPREHLGVVPRDRHRDRALHRADAPASRA